MHDYFCPPHVHFMAESPNMSDVLSALGLPQKAQVNGKWLIEYGKCRAHVESYNNASTHFHHDHSLKICQCRPVYHYSVLVLGIVCCLVALWSVVQMLDCYAHMDVSI